MEDVYYLWKSADANFFPTFGFLFLFWNVIPLMYLLNFNVTEQHKYVLNFEAEGKQCVILTFSLSYK